MHDASLAQATAALSPDTHGAPWWELCLTVSCAAADDAGALLVDAGALGAETLSHQAYVERAWQQHASMGPRALREIKPSKQTDACILVASFDGEQTKDAVQSLVKQELSGLVSEDALAQMVLVCRNDAAWAHAWREHYKPLKIGRSLWVVPRWDTRFLPPFGSTVVRIDPGMAFGTGQHATTSLCLKAIERRVAAARTWRTPLTMLDVGAGSGILAIAALALGASHATLIDIDKEAIVACQSNVEAAGLSARAVVQESWPKAGASYDLVCANILANTLVDMMPELLSRLAPQGTLLLSGILTDQADIVSRAVARTARRVNRDVPLVTRLQHDKWVALAYGAPLDATRASAAR